MSRWVPAFHGEDGGEVQEYIIFLVVNVSLNRREGLSFTVRYPTRENALGMIKKKKIFHQFISHAGSGNQTPVLYKELLCCINL